MEGAFALLFEKLNANLTARGEIVALLPEKHEMIIEFAGDFVPAYGAELLVFGVANEPAADEGEKGDAGGVLPVMIYRGAVLVDESAGHLNRVTITEGNDLFVEGDQVFLPTPVQLYVTPVKNLTPNPYFSSQATAAIAALLRSFANFAVFSLPASNQKTVAALTGKCRGEGRYGLLVQPQVVSQDGRNKAQLRLTSLFSGQDLGVLENEFNPLMAVPPQPLNGLR